VGPHQYDTVTGPLVGLVALVVLVTAAALAAAQAEGDFGLLVPVATVRTHEDAELLQSLLEAGGIRATVSPGERPGDRVVLVFRRDEAVARTLVAH
jgi:hypothetical protein